MGRKRVKSITQFVNVECNLKQVRLKLNIW